MHEILLHIKMLQCQEEIAHKKKKVYLYICPAKISCRIKLLEEGSLFFNW